MTDKDIPEELKNLADRLSELETDIAAIEDVCAKHTATLRTAEQSLADSEKSLNMTKKQRMDVLQQIADLVGEQRTRSIVPEEDPVLRRDIRDLGLSVRTANSLLANNICYVGNLIRMDERQLLMQQFIGKKMLNEIKEALASRGLQLGTRLENWPPTDLPR